MTEKNVTNLSDEPAQAEQPEAKTADRTPNEMDTTKQKTSARQPEDSAKDTRKTLQKTRIPIENGSPVSVSPVLAHVPKHVSSV